MFLPDADQVGKVIRYVSAGAAILLALVVVNDRMNPDNDKGESERPPADINDMDSDTEDIFLFEHHLPGDSLGQRVFHDFSRRRAYSRREQQLPSVPLSRPACRMNATPLEEGLEPPPPYEEACSPYYLDRRMPGSSRAPDPGPDRSSRDEFLVADCSLNELEGCTGDLDRRNKNRNKRRNRKGRRH
ncbi:hypothetical protein BC939DRAFT_446198 [Gamsiella multidivaricata]|uniref:uncharacterized protein n=1 Tax=Gamsiella multidivaricata TaxID=101098 RepID=UPI00221F1162|nr:uncharacterized protein BC939DRAFT_446198 [Gamsiella multidivaricata]KAI7826917.1 hypothetical protein BC939DRAFT_446198 [Gamsiella multidivaricata]